MLRILVVDDEEILRMLMKLVFEAHGYEVILAGCGEDALSLLQQESFDAVITDLQMGEVNGFDVVRYARNCSENSVIFMYTSCHEKEYEDTAKTMGVDKYIRKPASIEMLLNLLAEHLLQRVLGRNQFSCAAHG